MVVNELQSVETFIRGLYPSTTYKQTVPKKPIADTFVIRLLTDSRVNETHTSIRVDRTYPISPGSRQALYRNIRFDTFYLRVLKCASHLRDNPVAAE